MLLCTIRVIIITIAWSFLLLINFGSNSSLIPSVFAQQDPSVGDDTVSSFYSRAYEATEQGMYEQAIEYYDRALAIEPNNVYALTNKGVVLDELGRYPEAIQHFDRALAIEPNNVYALTNKGVVLDEIGYHQDALTTYQGAIVAEANRGIVLFRLSDYVGAIEIFDLILANDDSHVPSLYYKAQSLEILGFVDEANQYKNRAYEIDPNYQGDFIALTLPVIQQIGSPLQALLAPSNNKAVSLYNLENYEEAIEQHDSILVIEPNNVEALNNKGAALAALERYEEAIGYYDKALSIDPNYSLALVNKGAAIGELGRYQEAIGYFDRALNQRSITTTTTTNIAGVSITKEYPLLQPYPNLRDLGGAVVREGNMLLDNNLQEYEKRGELHYVTEFIHTKEKVDTEANKGIGLFSQGKYQEAINIFDRTLASTDDNHVPSLYCKAQSLEILGFVDEANQYKNRVQELAPNYQGEGFIETVATSTLLQSIVVALQQLLSP